MQSMEAAAVSEPGAIRMLHPESSPASGSHRKIMFGANNFANVSPRFTSPVKCTPPAKDAAAGALAAVRTAADAPGTARGAAATPLCTGCVFLQAICGSEKRRTTLTKNEAG